jgi:5S rRNA maturation endonuclease (ribonuclease M5)
MTRWVDFRWLKDNIRIEVVLARYGVRLHQVHSDYLRGGCPLPSHSSEQSRESFSVHTGHNVWACHSVSCGQARQGKSGGTVLDLVAYMEGCTLREAGLRLQSWSDWGTGRTPPEQLASKGRGICSHQEEPPRLPFALRLSGWHQYLEQRGVDPQTAEQFGVGYYTGGGFLKGRIVFPIHNAGGELVAYAGRAVNGGEPRYLFPGGFRKSQVIFNFHRALAGAKASAAQVIVVEGFFDCLKVHQAGYPNVVALMGTSLSQLQWKLLETRFREVILMLDGDAAGQRATQALSSRWPAVCVARMPAGCQPDQLSPGEIQGILGRSNCAPAAETAASPPPPEWSGQGRRREGEA